MNAYKTSIVVSVFTLFSSMSFADSGITQNSTELGYTTHPTNSALTRDQVQADLANWKKNPVIAGWREVGGELGWDRVPHAYGFASGKVTHIDNLNHDAPKAAKPNAIELRKSTSAQ